MFGFRCMPIGRNCRTYREDAQCAFAIGVVGLHYFTSLA